MKTVRLLPRALCSMLAAGGIVLAVPSLLHQPIVLAAAVPFQDATADNSTASLSGNWQMSWTGENGSQRKATLQLKQDGNKVSGKFQGERGAASVTGGLQGNQISMSVKVRRRDVSFSGTVSGDKMSGTTERGANWTATRQP